MESNHPPHVKKNLPKAINKRLVEISSNERNLDEKKEDYQNELYKSGYKHKLKFEKPQENSVAKKKRKRSRNIIWFTPPYNAALKTNIGKEFLKIIDKNFPMNPLSKTFNKGTLKIGYSCSKNIDQIISNHNLNIIKNENNNKNLKMCNCRKPEQCPVENNCLKKNVVYKATLTSGVNYIGMTSNTFKTRFNNQINSFKNESKKASTTLAQYLWNNNLNPEPVIKWQILQECKQYRPGQKACLLCTTEKLYIILNANNTKNINLRTDFGKKRPHKKRYTLDKPYTEFLEHEK